MAEALLDALTPAEWEAIKLSLRIALVAMAASLPFGIAIAYLLARYRFPGRTLVDGVVHLPLVMPPVVTGYLLLLAFGRRGPVGRLLEDSFGIVLAFRWTGAALACAIMGFPLMVRAIRLSIDAVDVRLEAAAARPFRRFGRRFGRCLGFREKPLHKSHGAARLLWLWRGAAGRPPDSRLPSWS